MKFSTIVAVLAIFGVVSVESLQLKNKVEAAQTEKLFSSFLSKFQRNYRDKSEYTNRLSNFAKNLEFVNNNNANNKDFTLELNKFADLSNAEFKSMLGLRTDLIDDSDNDAQVNAEITEMQVNAPASLDWRATPGYVPIVKNQASCGSCYAFAALEALQSLYHIKKGPAADINGVINLSEQQIVDCSTGYKNQGCNGGLMDYVYNYLKVYPTMLDVDYKYTARKGTCVHNTAKGKFKVSTYQKLPNNNPTALLNAVVNGPVSIALRASSSTFQLYKTGIITSTACGTTIDHAVTLVGYGTQNGQDYWIIKNSWGASWGESGYVRIARNMSSTDTGICGIYQYSVQPLTINI